MALRALRPAVPGKRWWNRMALTCPLRWWKDPGPASPLAPLSTAEASDQRKAAPLACRAA